jgi:hypothetical protein
MSVHPDVMMMAPMSRHPHHAVTMFNIVLAMVVVRTIADLDVDVLRLRGGRGRRANAASIATMSNFNLFMMPNIRNRGGNARVWPAKKTAAR